MKYKRIVHRVKMSPWRGPVIIYSLIALAVLLPMLRPGYILTLDMVFTPHIPIPDTIGPNYLFQATLHGLNSLLPADVIQKIILFLILFWSGLGMHQLMLQLRPAKTEQGEYEKWGMYLAGALYMINPFTYSRFMAGQYAVLLGYSLLPFFVRALLAFFAQPGRRPALVVAGWLIALSLVSIHTVGLGVLVAVVATVLYAWRHRTRSAQLKAFGIYGALAIAVFLVASSYWLVPLLQGKGNTAEAIRHFETTNQQAFVTIGDGAIEKVANIARLQGFWAEIHALYVLPQDHLPVWGLAALGIWILVIMGGVALWRRWKRAEVLLFAVCALLACSIAVGSLNDWLTRTIPFFAGYREPHKFVAFVALAYAVLAGQAASELFRKASARQRDFVAAGIVALPLLFTPTMFWGFGGQLKPRHYPHDWFAVNEQLNQDQDDYRVLFLPWHQYLTYGFAGRVIASPAPDFYDQPMIVSNDPEFQDATGYNNDPTRQAIAHLLKSPDKRDLADKLAELNVKYVLLAKEHDFRDYSYLNSQKDLRQISETDTLKLYRNEAWRKE